MLRPAVLFEVAGGSNGQHARLEQLARDQAIHGRFAEAHRDVDSIGDKVADVLARYQFQRQFGMLTEKAADMAGENHAGKIRIDVDAQASANNTGRTRRSRGRILDTRQQGPDLFVETPAFVGERDRTGGSVEQADTYPLFEARNRATDARRGNAERVGGPRKTAALDHRRQYTDARQQTAVEGHFTSMTACQQ